MTKMPIRIQLRGNFAVTSGDGENLTPKSKKAQGILALLSECDTMVRGRRWLEDKLWSDRGPEQASGSLRTTLNEIRRSFGDSAHVLGSSRHNVWLVRSDVVTDIEDTNSLREFLEGLDIADPEFNGWLLQQRIRYNPHNDDQQIATSDLAKRITIQCGTPWNKQGKHETFSQIITDQIGKIVSDFIAFSRCSASERNADLIIRTSLQDDSSRSAVFVQVIDPIKDEIVHSDHCFIDDVGCFVRNQVSLGRFCWNVADLTLEKLPHVRHEVNPVAIRSGFVQEALNKVLSFEARQMQSSLLTLDSATDHLNAGLFLALKAWSMTSMIMEEFLQEDQTTVSEIKAHLRRAREVSPGDPMVAAVTANVGAILFEDFNDAMHLARGALRHNPNNIFALQAMSVGRAARGDLDLAYDISRHCCAISNFSKFEAMCNLHHALLCMNLQKTDEALISSQLAADLSPNYRAPRRQLIALCAIQNQSSQSLLHMKDLKGIEPDFTLERFLYDRTYPSNTLRKSGHLSKAKTFLSEST